MLARRLVEHGCGFVTVMDAGWDMHANENSPRTRRTASTGSATRSITLVLDLSPTSSGGLSDKILLVVTGEMGRSPRLSNNGGRDHWGNLTPLLIAGGGLKMGQVGNSPIARPALPRPNATRRITSCAP